MSFSRSRRVPPQGGNYHTEAKSSFAKDDYSKNCDSKTFDSRELSRKFHDHHYRMEADIDSSFKRRKFTNSWEDGGKHYLHGNVQKLNAVSDPPSTSNSPYRNAARFDTMVTRAQTERPEAEGDILFMSRDEIERCSPSRKDGIDLIRETQLRYTYCTFLQNLGARLDLPQTTIGTAMVLCHRFFVHRSHATHDRFLIATAALFLTSKSEDTPRPLNTVLRLSYEVCHKQDLAFFPYLLPVDWFEKYRERVLEAEHMILTTLDFELNVMHPYAPLTSVLSKLGLSQSVLVELAWNLVNEGLRSSLWLQFKPHHIAAGAAFLAAKFLNLDFSSNRIMCQEFQTTPTILKDVVQQLMELF